MSGIAQLYNIPGDPKESNSWSFAHSSHHRDIIKAIHEQYGVNLPEYVLDPVPVQDLSTWIYQHQQMHNDMNGILRVSGYNLSNVDWKNIESRSSWIFSNATEHTNIAGLLRIGPSVLPPVTILITPRSSSSQQTAPLVSQQSFTFSGLAAGPASASRYVIVCVAAVANTNTGIANVTINGIATTVLASTFALTQSAGIFIAYVPSGTTVNVVVTNNSFSVNNGVNVSVYSITGITSPAASDAASVNSSSAPSATFSVNANGAVIGVATNFGNGFTPSSTWSGITKDTQFTYTFPGSTIITQGTAASRDFAAFQSVTARCSFIGSTPAGAGCFASFNP